MKQAINMKQIIKAVFPVLLLALVLFIMLVAVSRGQTKENQTQEFAASGGTFTLEKSVVAGGGSQKQLMPMSENGTSGQTVAGTTSTGGQFKIYTGFWTPDSFAPTAATASIGGRVRTEDGRGIKNVSVLITFPNGVSQRALSSSFGYFSFAEIPVGATYVISAKAKRFTFSQSAQLLNLVGDVSDIEFVANAPDDANVSIQP